MYAWENLWKAASLTLSNTSNIVSSYDYIMQVNSLGASSLEFCCAMCWRWEDGQEL